MKINDAVFGLLLLVLGAVVLAVVQSYPKIPGQQVGPALFPGLIAAGLCLCGAMLVLKGWRERREQPWLCFGDWVRSPRHVLALALVVFGVVFYILAANTLGFLIVSITILTALMWSLQVRPAVALLVAVVATLVIYTLFYKLLRVPLPWASSHLTPGSPCLLLWCKLSRWCSSRTR
ncbi:tripartite tricarboxylate transporter TctB family protein [Variovorax sp. PAMC 28711]|uniref:tripartite tricarboxylate transporter TctB family protein n=1 Tax=Variovorax sp. PAMC 28711 TaxID=1795631 RepID=UPI000AA5C4AD|nr:tripartite tricarboxylate transporter TctB family protein [Variovorax sp. PAMC 28711]